MFHFDKDLILKNKSIGFAIVLIHTFSGSIRYQEKIVIFEINKIYLFEQGIAQEIWITDPNYQNWV